MKSSIGKHIFHFLLLASLILFAFWFALKDDMEDVLTRIQNVSVFYLVLVVNMGIAYYVLQGYMLTILARKYEKSITFWDGIENAYSAAFFNGVTPLGGGQVAQTYVFHKKKIGYGNIASILWKDFFLYQCVVVFFAGILLIVHVPYCFSTFPTIIWLVYLGWGIDASVIVLLWTMSYFPNLYAKIMNWGVNVLCKLHIVKNKQTKLAKWNLQIHYFAEEVKSLKEDHRLIMKGLLLNLLRQILYYSIPFFVGIGLGMSLGWSDYVLVLVLSCCIHMMNALTPLPGDTGWTESVFIILFCFVFQRSYASSIMILWRMATYYVPIVIGGVIFLIVKCRTKKVDPLKMGISASKSSTCTRSTKQQSNLCTPLEEL